MIVYKFLVVTSFIIITLAFGSCAMANTPFKIYAYDETYLGSRYSSGPEITCISKFATEKGQKCGTYHVDMGLTIGHPDNYKKFIKFLDSLGPDQTVVLKYSNFGGYVHTGSMLLNAINRTMAYTISRIDGPSYSMAAVLACATDELDLQPNSYLMYHTYRTKTEGNGQEVLTDALSTHRLLKNMMKPCIGKGVLTQNQIDDILMGRDMYIFQEDIKK